MPKYFEQAEKTEPKAKFIDEYKESTRRDFPYDQAPLCSSSCYDHVYMLVEAMKKAGTVDDVAKVRQGAVVDDLSRAVEHPLRRRRGEEIFGFDIVDMKKGGKITCTHIEPK